MIATVDQKAIFAQRLNRISSGQHFEHADVLGHQTHKAYKKKVGVKGKRPKRTFLERMMIIVALFCGLASAVIGRLAYVFLTKLDGLPEAVYKLEGRGVFLCVLLTALSLIMVFQLFTRGRLQSLALGCLMMHFGGPALANNVPQLGDILPQSYIAALSGTLDNSASG